MISINFGHLWAETPPIPLHAVMAMVALALGTVQMTAAKGTVLHRISGYLWVGLMAGVAITAMFISEINTWGYFSPIHLLVPVVLISLWLAIRAARKGEIQRHRRIMQYHFFLALVVTGAFTLLPGRVMHQVFFSGG